VKLQNWNQVGKILTKKCKF